MNMEYRSQSADAHNFYEKSAWSKDALVCGIDEVGRGCFAGPLVISAVILPQNTKNPLLKDSKVLSEAQRLKAYAWIEKNCFFSSAIISPQDIDRLNIYQATLKGMKRALFGLWSTLPKEASLSTILLDAMPLKLTEVGGQKISCISAPKGESWSASIAAASIVAKVRRDALMGKYDLVVPGYELGTHKGYGTSKHQKALMSKGISLLHRKSFLVKFFDKNVEQKSIL